MVNSRSTCWRVALAIAALMPGLAHAQVDCSTANINATLYSGNQLAQSWSVLEILLASPDGTMPPAWTAQDNGNAALGATPPDRWTKVFSDSLQLFDQYAKACSPTDFELQNGLTQEAFDQPIPKEALEVYASSHRISSAQLSPLIGLKGGLPAPRPLQFSLSQVTTQGQPGFIPSISGSPFAKSTKPFWRHVLLAFNATLINPSGGTTEQAATPVLSSIDLFISTSTVPTPSDWFLYVSKNLTRDQVRVNGLRMSAVVQLVRLYKAKQPDASSRGPVFKAAAEAANDYFRRSVLDYYSEQYIVPIETETDSIDASVALRLRATPNATWTPELPDLLSGSLEGAVNVLMLDTSNSGQLTATASLAGAYSAFPTSEFQKWSEIDSYSQSRHSLLIDATLGLTYSLPSTIPLASTRLSASAVGRLAPLRPLPGGGVEGNLGGSAALEVPVSKGVALVGSYTFRCNRGCTAVSGLTLAVTNVD